MAEVLEQITDRTFADLVEGADLPYLVEFMSSTCAPCRQLEPVLEEIAVEMTGRMRVGQLDIVRSPHTPGKLGVRSTPTMILFRSGEPLRRLMGAKNKRTLTEALVEYIS